MYIICRFRVWNIRISQKVLRALYGVHAMSWRLSVPLDKPSIASEIHPRHFTLDVNQLRLTSHCCTQSAPPSICCHGVRSETILRQGQTRHRSNRSSGLDIAATREIALEEARYANTYPDAPRYTREGPSQKRCMSSHRFSSCQVNAGANCIS
jgi:hypothetical protein